MPASKLLEKLNIITITDYRAENVSITVLIPTEKLHQLMNSGNCRLHIEFLPIRTSNPSDQWIYRPLNCHRFCIVELHDSGQCNSKFLIRSLN